MCQRILMGLLFWSRLSLAANELPPHDNVRLHYELLNSKGQVIGSSLKSYQKLAEAPQPLYESRNSLHLKTTIFGFALNIDESDRMQHDGQNILKIEADGVYKIPLRSQKRIRWQGERKDKSFVVSKTEADDEPQTQSFPHDTFQTFARYLYDLKPAVLGAASKGELALIDLNEMKVVTTPFWQAGAKDFTIQSQTYPAAAFGFEGKRGKLTVYALSNGWVAATESEYVSSRLVSWELLPPLAPSAP